MADKFIAVSGNIGVGKTSLVEYLHRNYGFEPIFEPFADNPYLDDYYKNMKAWGFHSQVWFLAHKFRLHQDFGGKSGTFIQDRTIYEDAQIFATYMYKSRRMSKRDYQTYLEMYQTMERTLRPPDLMIHLKCSVRAIRRRVKQRGRASEQDIPASYLRKLNDLYGDWIDSYDQSPVLVWDSEKGDYLTNLVDQAAFHQAIHKFL